MNRVSQSHPNILDMIQERHRRPDHQHSHQGPQARQRRLQDPPLRRGALCGLCHRHRHRPGRSHRPGAEPQRGPDPHRHHQDLNPNTSGRGYFPSPAVFFRIRKNHAALDCRKCMLTARWRILPCTRRSGPPDRRRHPSEAPYCSPPLFFLSIIASVSPNKKPGVKRR